ncbi:hypothetical protein Q5H92_21745 [Hymenobacter sp. M29]|uniref:Uncharacterized protein n=1 Tax=Hymenobacter mellowenesis TaxID=3063995 RepID=A0ABT9AHF9_9BACT|nr:hypothetical protein [Hymenobacter sp. M29]MDO7849003.1 hypothetical protein [Hymenobacter sp. M29]
MPQNVPNFSARNKSIGSTGLTTDVNADSVQIAAITAFINGLEPSAFISGTYTAGADGAQTITVPNAVLFGSVGVEGPGGSLNPLAYGSGYTQAGNVLTVLAAVNVKAGEVILFSYLAGTVTATYDDTPLQNRLSAVENTLAAAVDVSAVSGAKRVAVVQAIINSLAQTPAGPAFVLDSVAFVSGDPLTGADYIGRTFPDIRNSGLPYVYRCDRAIDSAGVERIIWFRLKIQ